MNGNFRIFHSIELNWNYIFQCTAVHLRALTIESEKLRVGKDIDYEKFIPHGESPTRASEKRFVETMSKRCRNDVNFMKFASG